MYVCLVLAVQSAAAQPPEAQAHSASARVRWHDQPSLGAEVRTDGVFFGRLRAEAFPGADALLYRVVEDRVRAGGRDEQVQRTQWVGRRGSLDLGWRPIAGLRVGGRATSEEVFTRRGWRWLVEENRIAPDTRGVTRAGPTVWAGLSRGPASLHLRTGVEVPLFARSGNPDDPDHLPAHPDGGRYPTRQMHGTRVEAVLEGRLQHEAWVLDAELGVGTTGASPYRRAHWDELPYRATADLQLALAVGRTFGARTPAEVSAPDAER